MNRLPIPEHEVYLDAHLALGVCVGAVVVFLTVRFILLLLGR